MIKLDDIVALAKQGYKPSDIKELIELSKEAPASEEKEPDQETEKENITDDKTPSDTVAPEKEDKHSDDQEASKVVDYKKKVEELEKKISDLQKANTRKNVADTDEKSDSEVIADLMKSFM